MVTKSKGEKLDEQNSYMILKMLSHRAYILVSKRKTVTTRRKTAQSLDWMGG